MYDERPTLDEFQDRVQPEVALEAALQEWADDRLLELAAEVARLVCVNDAQYVDDPAAHKRLDFAANEIGFLLRLPEPEFAELWRRRSPS